MKNKNFATTQVVYLSLWNNYVNELNDYLLAFNQTTTPERHKQVVLHKDKSDELKTKFTRPYICFNFDSNKALSLCFPLGTFKYYDDLTDPKFYFLVDEFNRILGKLIITKPIYIPTKILKTIDFQDEENEAKKIKRSDLVNWLRKLKNEARLCRTKYPSIKIKFNNIKLSRNSKGIDYNFVHNHYFINQDLSYDFATQYLKK